MPSNILKFGLLGMGLGISGGQHWTPASAIGGTLPILWLDASRISGLADGATVDTWTDLSAHNNATQTGAPRPIYKTGIINGKPVVRFNGTSQYMTLGDFGGGLTQFSAFFVSSAADPVNSAMYWIGGRNHATLNINNLTFQSLSASKSLRSIVGVTTQSYVTGFTDNVLVPGQAHLINFDWDGTTIRCYLDSQISTITGSPSGTTVGGINRFLGGTTNDNGATTGGLGKGDIAEVVFYPRHLTDAERHTVEDYLQ